MSTRSTTHFYWSKEDFDRNEPPAAIVYRHHDGYPAGAGVDLLNFVEDVKAQCDPTREGATYYGTRFGDASYLAAKYLVYLTVYGYKYDQDYPLDFGGVGILTSDPVDIEWRYIVIADGEPTLYVQDLCDRFGNGSDVLHYVEDAIALEDKAQV